MIRFCLETFFAHEKIDAVQIVADRAWRDYILYHVRQIGEGSEAMGKFRGFSEPGANRQMSIYHALTDIREYGGDNDTVVIHDGARPFVKAAQISRCLADMEGHDGALPVLPMKDTVYLADGARICSLLDRKRVYAGQAPELFLFGKYYEANRALLPDRILSVNGSTEPAPMKPWEMEKLILADGWAFKNQEGSHKNYIHPTKPGKVTIPFYNKDLPKGTENNIRKQAGLK